LPGETPEEEEEEGRGDHGEVAAVEGEHVGEEVVGAVGNRGDVEASRAERREGLRMAERVDWRMDWRMGWEMGAGQASLAEVLTEEES